jgi:hypothetical protein
VLPVGSAVGRVPFIPRSRLGSPVRGHALRDDRRVTHAVIVTLAVLGVVGQVLVAVLLAAASR